MDARGARSKGRRWDNTVARMLSEWYFGVPDALQRTHGSRSIKGFGDQVGDLGVARTGLDKPWVFGVENKHRDASSRKSGAWSIDDLVKNGRSAELNRYWNQCVTAAQAGQKIPLLVVKKNHFPPIVIVPYEDWRHYLDSPNAQLFKEHTVTLESSELFISIMLLQLFLTTNPDAWITMWEEYYR